MLSCRTINWDQIQKKVKNYDWAMACVKQIEKDFQQIPEITPPLEPSEWAHYYYCPDCAIRLSFSFDQPHHHYCPICSRDLSGGVYDGAWRKAVHGSIISNLERAAVLANLKPDNEIYVAYLRRIILFYADHYRDYEVHGTHVGQGKIMPQSLTEAVFIIALEQILRMICNLNLFSQKEWVHIQQDLFQLAAELIWPQINQIHNTHAWMISAICACASVLEDKEMLEKAIYGPFGWLQQLEKGVNEDGIWFEISPGYHFYALQALLGGAWIAKEHNIPVYQHHKLLKMGTSIYQIIYPNGYLPAYNDSSYLANIGKYAYLFEQLYALQEEPEFETQLSFAYSKAESHGCTPMNTLVDYIQTPSNGYVRNSIAALLYGKPDLAESISSPNQSVLLPHSGIAILRQDDMRVALKFSPNCQMHDHCDKLSLELTRLSERLCYDTGTSGYTANLTNEWCRTPLAHNMVVIDQKKQAYCDAKLIDYAPDHVEAAADASYPGVMLKRKIQMIPSGFVDTFSVESDEEHCIDYVFRCSGILDCSLPMENATPFTEHNGYNQLMNLKKAISSKEFTVTWHTEVSKVQLLIKSWPKTEVFTADCFGVDRTQAQTILILRRHSNQTTFHVTAKISASTKESNSPSVINSN